MNKLIQFIGLTLIAGGISLAIFGVIITIVVLRVLFIAWGIVGIALGMALILNEAGGEVR